MKNRIYVAIALNLIMVIAVFCGGVYYGYHTGVTNFYHLENVLSSNIDVLRAKDLKGGSKKELKHINWEFEMSINKALDSYNWFQESGNHFFSKLFFAGHLEHLETSIENIARHRYSNPIDDEAESLVCELPDSNFDRRHCLETIEKRRELVEKYGSKR